MMRLCEVPQTTDRSPAVVRILVVEDEPKVAGVVVDALRETGLDVDSVSTGTAALERLLEAKYDLLVLDLMLPDQDGLEVCKRVRVLGLSLPILFLSARHRVDDRVRGLDAGADDYLTKPFDAIELQARVRALLRRPSEATLTPLVVGDLELNLVSRQVRRGPRKIELTPKEFALLEFLMRNVGHAVTRNMITEQVWGLSWDPLTNVIEVFINHLRKKIEADDEPRLVHSIRGVGYVMKVPDSVD
jgi:DNA-binding response OmpR family regulator